MNISIIKQNECYGCGVCSFVCPSKAISMYTDIEGFLYPNVNADLCVECGQCIKMCQSHDLTEPLEHVKKKIRMQA